MSKGVAIVKEGWPFILTLHTHTSFILILSYSYSHFMNDMNDSVSELDRIKNVHGTASLLRRNW